MIVFAESIRDRKLMFKVYMSNGTRYRYLAALNENYDKALGYYNEAMQLARQNKLEEQMAMAYIGLAELELQVLNKDASLENINQAISIASGNSNDSLKAACYNTAGSVYLLRNEKLLALRSVFNGLRLAEDIKNNTLLISSYEDLADFYSGIEQYDKALDYLNMELNANTKSQSVLKGLQEVRILDKIGEVYSWKKNFDLAIAYTSRSIHKADSVNFPELKLNGYSSLMRYYLVRKQPQKALTYFNSPEGTVLKNYMVNTGQSFQIDYGYATMYSELGNFDSAQYYYEKVKPVIDKMNSDTYSIYFYAQYSNHLKISGKKSGSIRGFEYLKQLSEKNNLIEYVKNAAAQLDTLYSQAGDYRAAILNKDIYYKYKDSIAVLNKEKELAALEVNDEQQRQARVAKEMEEAKKRRNNIQYLGITIGILTLFIAMVILGMFKVSANVIRAIGFLTFLMLFEFMFLIFKKNIHSITHGEPWKDLLAMILLAAILVPFHHWLEHKVLHILTSQNRLTDAGNVIKSKLSNSRQG